jgi:NADH dehydrogenase
MVHVSANGADLEADSDFASTKGRGERAVREAFPGATIILPSLVFGPEDRFFNNIAGLARVLPLLPLIGGGRTRFQPVFVGDVAAAIARAVVDRSLRGRVCHLGGPKVYSFRELLEFILTETGRKRILVPIPFFLATILGFVLQKPSFILPIRPILTVDLVRLLKSDNVVQQRDVTFDDLDINPASVESVVPGYLWRFHPKGQFRQQHHVAAER